MSAFLLPRFAVVFCALAAAGDDTNETCRLEEASILQAAAARVTRAPRASWPGDCQNLKMQMQFDRSTHAYPLTNLYWLHFPKAGTSFISSLWNYACGQGSSQLDLAVSDNYRLGCSRCYDYALMERYPKAKYCAPGVLHTSFTTEHRPISWAQVKNKSMKVAAMFRKPSQRMISAYRDGLHSNGFAAEDSAALRARCSSNGFSTNVSAACFARFPGIGGCMTRMLSGHRCAQSSAERNGSAFDGGYGLVQDAKKMIEQLSFVGLTERWNESVCLFHRMFGGSINPAEFMNFHHNHDHSGKELYAEDSLEGYYDAADEQIYRFAKVQFERLLREHVPHGQLACDGLPRFDSAQDSCSCQAQGRQCGSVREVGLDCGRCPWGRLTYATANANDDDLTVDCNLGMCKTNVPGWRTLFNWTWSSSV